MKTTLWLVAVLVASLMSLVAAGKIEEQLKPALDVITPDSLLGHIKILASDEFEGRAPGTKCEELSVNYITDQFAKAGLKPGNPNGSYVQEVPLAGIASEPTMSFTVGDKKTDLKYPDDYAASSASLQEDIKVHNADVVFVGCGIVAPEYGWNDYKNVALKGKNLLMF